MVVVVVLEAYAIDLVDAWVLSVPVRLKLSYYYLLSLLLLFGLDS